MLFFWPVAMDIKYKDVEAMPDKSIDVVFFNGAIRTEENEHMAKILRSTKIANRENKKRSKKSPKLKSVVGLKASRLVGGGR